MKKLKGKKGITLIALVITIIVLIILAAVALGVLTGENGLINRAIMSSFATEMRGVKEKINLKKQELETEKVLTGENNQLFSTNVSIEDKLPDTLKQEIMYFRDGAPSDKSPSDYNVEEFESYITVNDGSIEALWKVENLEDTKDGIYIYDEKIDIVFKIKQTQIAGKIYHSYEAMTLGKGGTGVEEVAQDTIIKEEFNDYSLGYYEPDLKGYDSDDTYMVYYSENILNSNDNITTKLIPIRDYIDGGKQREIEIDETKYIAYDYKNKIWANVVSKANGVETWWVWVPRYAYNTEITNNNFDILFTTIENEVIILEDNKTSVKDLSEFSGYIAHTGFSLQGNIELKGIWMSKFNPTYTNEITPTTKARKLYYEPNTDGFDKDNTSMVYYSEDFTKTYKMNLKDYIASGRPRTTLVENETYTLYDYHKRIWANIVSEANGVETWWVWVPRYAYNAKDIQTGEFSIIFVDKDDKPMDTETYGNTLPKDYILHSGFDVTDKKETGDVTTKLEGIWMSKFNPTYTNEFNPTSTSDKLYYEPNIEGFDTENSSMVYYSKDFSSTYKMKLSEYIANGQPRTTTVDGETYTLYDYHKQIWANIVSDANGIETWWVWIPRYAYSTNIQTGEFSIIFIDTNDKPIDTATYGEKLPEGYIVHSGFDVTDKKETGDVTTKLKGIWMSKFNPTYDSTTSTKEEDTTLSN